MTHRIILPQWQHVAGLKGAVSLIHRRCVQRGISAAVMRNPWEYPCPYKPGDALVCLEPWVRFADGRETTRAEWEEEVGLKVPEFFATASQMPLRVCRLKFTVVSARAVRMRDVTDENAVKAGIAEYLHQMPGLDFNFQTVAEDPEDAWRNNSSSQNLKILWETRPGHSWEGWAWALEVTR